MISGHQPYNPQCPTSQSFEALSLSQAINYTFCVQVCVKSEQQQQKTTALVIKLLREIKL